MDEIGPYRVLSRLGAGGFGEVFLALDPDGRTAAVKVLHPHVADEPGARDRLAREVDSMRKIRSSHVAEVLGADMLAPRPYIATRYVQGRPLTEVAPVRGPDLVRLARGLAEALAAMSEAGVVHRDLKPSNVIVAEGWPVVIDFGVASDSGLRDQVLIGTPGYVAPEVLGGGSHTPAADSFGWAATMAYAATGRHPFGVGPAEGIAYRVTHGESDISGVPAWLESLVRDGLRDNPQARPSAARLTAELSLIGTEATTREQVIRESETVTRVAGQTEPVTPVAGPPGFSEGLEERLRLSRRRWWERIRPWLFGMGALVLGVLAGALNATQAAALSIQGGFVAILLVDLFVNGRSRAVFNVTAAAVCVALAQVLPLMLASVWIWAILGGLILSVLLIVSLS